MAVNGEGIHGTRPWRKFGEGAPVQAADQSSKMFNEGSRRALDARDIRFTTKGDVLYAFVMGKPEFRTLIRSLATDTALKVGRISSVELVGTTASSPGRRTGPDSRSTFPTRCPAKHAVSFRIRGAA
jgi:alpha-L-fucosidase